MSERVEVYIRNVANALERGSFDESVREVVSLAEAYLRDAQHYLRSGDVFTALAAISYAEGLLDALRILGLARFEWLRPSEIAKNMRRVLVAGTFEIIHPGHIAYLREAWSLGRVVAVVARDVNVERIKRRRVVIPENQRAEVLSAIRYVHEVRLGYEDDFLRIVEEVKPDVILLGPNQPFDESDLAERLRRRGVEAVVARARSFVGCELCSVSRILKKVCESCDERFA